MQENCHQICGEISLFFFILIAGIIIIMWEEVKKAKTENRREFVLSGKLLQIRMKETGNDLDPDIFTLTNLNFLDLSSTGSDLKISSLPDGIGCLTELTTLIMGSVVMEGALPGETLAKLVKLKVVMTYDILTKPNNRPMPRF